jgi:hypothetical protein
MKNTQLLNINVTPFRVNVAGLLFTRAINTKQTFEMASHAKIDTLCMFNDITLKLGEYTMFLQLKDCPWYNKNIEISQFLRLEGDFSLLRYCKTFGEIKKEWMQNKDLQNYGRFEDSIFIVYTNGEMSHEKEHDVDNTVWQKVICSGGKCFNFSEDKFPEVHEMFGNLETCKQLLANVRYDSKVASCHQLLGFINKVRKPKATALPDVFEAQKLLKELQDLGDLSHYKQFLSSFWFVTGQANNQTHEKQIKRELGLACGTSITNLMYSNFKQKIHDWCRHSNELLTQESPFSKDMFHSANGLGVSSDMI